MQKIRGLGFGFGLWIFVASVSAQAQGTPFEILGLKLGSWLDHSPIGPKHEGPSIQFVDEVSPGALPSLSPEGTLKDLRLALVRSTQVCRKQNLDESVAFGSNRFTRRKFCMASAEKMIRWIDENPEASAEQFATFLKAEFRWFKSRGAPDTKQVKYTGYYFPTFEGRDRPSSEFSVPVYGWPKTFQLVDSGSGSKVCRMKSSGGKLKECPTRKEIYEGALDGLGAELVYTNNAFEAFIHQVQGSGAATVTRVDGSVYRQILNYAGGNSQPYVSIRRILLEQGVHEDYLTLQGLRRYFKEYPDQLIPVLSKSPSFVFFKKDDDGPFGSQGSVITPGHSIAVDRSIFPMGAIGWVAAERPVAEGLEGPGSPGNGGRDPLPGEVSWKPFTRVMVAQDTGGAIKTAGRVDLYWGEDDYAEFAAGKMNTVGDLFFAIAR